MGQYHRRAFVRGQKPIGRQGVEPGENLAHPAAIENHERVKRVAKSVLRGRRKPKIHIGNGWASMAKKRNKANPLIHNGRYIHRLDHLIRVAFAERTDLAPQQSPGENIAQATHRCPQTLRFVFALAPADVDDFLAPQSVRRGTFELFHLGQVREDLLVCRHIEPARRNGGCVWCLTVQTRRQQNIGPRIANRRDQIVGGCFNIVRITIGLPHQQHIFYGRSREHKVQKPPERQRTAFAVIEGVE